METLIILQELVEEYMAPDYYMPDMVDKVTYRLFTDYEKARAWAEEWVKEYNGKIACTQVIDGEKVDLPALVEEVPNKWECFLATRHYTPKK